MKIVIQRVKNAHVSVEHEKVGEISEGFVLLVGFVEGDTEKDYQKAADKIAGIRLFDDENGVMNRSIIDIKGAILSISQFTLAADAKKGNRPSYIQAMEPHQANQFYQAFNQHLRGHGIVVEEGVFQADMKVSLVNDGPVTIILNIENGKVI
ncbi:D-tyrosyl-tRNA(Tyr) deacylase [Erysipelothrix larvae]|uniref:D-aminoacyl-tRNA deacylase n=1 Tax=Erysipelothrix larvae TaxID=1514105 RepID=A0A0X8GXW6_9FIRM|nr:D-aminoacyl-tRNA deacylase [Erysipelothrix larvae]AMC92455.1 D-tyrosyl-tRNA(Tyr) deacylase [Erysipelothrix larvae]